MDRKLTVKEKVFLEELRELMAKHSVMLYSENDRVCMDIEYSGDIPMWMTRWNRSCCRRDSRYITKLMNS